MSKTCQTLNPLKYKGFIMLNNSVNPISGNLRKVFPKTGKIFKAGKLEILLLILIRVYTFGKIPSHPSCKEFTKHLLYPNNSKQPRRSLQLV